MQKTTQVVQGNVVQGGVYPPGSTDQVVYQTAPPIQTGPRMYQGYAANASCCVGTMMIGIGLCLVVLDVVGIVIDKLPPIGMIGSTGLYISIFFVITGSFGVSAGRLRTHCTVITFMVLCIISAVLSIPVIVTFAVSAATSHRKDLDQQARVGVRALMSVLGGLMEVLSIVGSALCCAVVCCGGRQTAQQGVVYGQQTQYVTFQQQPAPGQPSVTITQQNPVGQQPSKQQMSVYPQQPAVPSQATAPAMYQPPPYQDEPLPPYNPDTKFTPQ